MKNQPKLDNRLKPGDVFHVDAYSDKLWLEDYHVKVSSNVTVIKQPTTNAKKVFVRMDELDGDYDVPVLINKKYLTNRIK